MNYIKEGTLRLLAACKKTGRRCLLNCLLCHPNIQSVKAELNWAFVPIESACQEMIRKKTLLLSVFYISTLTMTDLYTWFTIAPKFGTLMMIYHHTKITITLKFGTLNEDDLPSHQSWVLLTDDDLPSCQSLVLWLMMIYHHKKVLHQSWKHMSIHPLLIPHKSHNCKIPKNYSQTKYKTKHTSNTIF